MTATQILPFTILASYFSSLHPNTALCLTSLSLIFRFPSPSLASDEMQASGKNSCFLSCILRRKEFLSHLLPPQNQQRVPTRVLAPCSWDGTPPFPHIFPMWMLSPSTSSSPPLDLNYSFTEDFDPDSLFPFSLLLLTEAEKENAISTSYNSFNILTPSSSKGSTSHNL